MWEKKWVHEGWADQFGESSVYGSLFTLRFDLGN